MLRGSLLLYWVFLSSAFSTEKTFQEREGHVSFLLRNALYIYGGYNSKTETYLDDVWKLDEVLGVLVPCASEGDLPIPRQGAAAVPINDDFVFVYGGDDGKYFFSDFYLVTEINGTVTWLSGRKQNDATLIEGRSGHSMATDGNGNVFIFGGMLKKGKLSNDLLKISLAATNEINQGEHFLVGIQIYIAESASNANSTKTLIMKGNVPPGSLGSTLTYSLGAFYLIGGYTGDSYSKTEFCSIYRLNLDEAGAVSWSSIQTTQPSPRRREFHSAIRFKEDILITGGCVAIPDTMECFNDFWIYQPKKNLWLDVSKTLVSAEFSVQYKPRMKHTAIIDKNGFFIITGGSRLGFELFGILKSQARINLGPCSEYCDLRGGYCQNKTCVCSRDYFGYDCRDKSYRNYRTTDLCSLHGYLRFDGKCECFLGYHGISCEMGQSECLNDCSGNGACNSNSQCECFEGFVSEDCSVASKCPKSCCSHGKCSASNRCLCDTNYFGKSCAINSDQILYAKKALEANRVLLNRLQKNVEGLLQGTVSMHQDVRNSKGEIVSKEYLIQSLNDVNIIVKDKLSRCTPDMSMENIANAFYAEECNATLTLSYLSHEDISKINAVFAGSKRNSRESMLTPKLNGFTSTGGTLYEQIRSTIERIKRENMRGNAAPSASLEHTKESNVSPLVPFGKTTKGNAAPSGPFDQSIEDIYDEAEKYLKDTTKAKQLLEKTIEEIHINKVPANSFLGITSMILSSFCCFSTLWAIYFLNKEEKKPQMLVKNYGENSKLLESDESDSLIYPVTSEDDVSFRRMRESSLSENL